MSSVEQEQVLLYIRQKSASMANNTKYISNRPEQATDGLSAILGKLGMKVEIFMQADLCGLWAMDTSGQRKVPFHLVEQGTGWLHTESEPPRMLGSGDFVVFPHDTPHCISSGPERPPPEIVNQVPENPTGRITSLLCGFFVFDNRNAWPLLDSLPNAIVLDLKQGGRHHSVFPLVQLMISELELD